jgi:hypothetical protein
MASPTVFTLNVFRVEDGESVTGWSSIGGGQGGSAEPSFAYQGTNLFNRKVSSSTGAGFYYTPTLDGGSPVDMSTPPYNTLMVKCAVTDFGGLRSTNGVRIRIGSSSSAYKEFVIAGSLAKKASYSAYPERGGFLIIPIDPNLTWNYESGSLNATSVNYFGMVAAFTQSTAKSENVGLDALDVGEGLYLVGGDGAGPVATFQDFFNFDEGNKANRYGFFTKLASGLYRAFGTIKIGDGSTPTVFESVDETVLFYDGYFADGWSKLLFDLSGPTTVSNFSATLKSLGTVTSGSDTRADFVVQGTTGTLTFDGVIDNFREVVLTSVCDLSLSSIRAKKIIQNGANLSGAEIVTISNPDDSATLVDPDFSKLANVEFVQESADTHAIKITSPGVYTLDGVSFLGYGSDGSNTSAIFNDSGGSVTLNITGSGDTPTVTNGVGASTTVNNAVTVTVKVLDIGTKTPIQGARVYIEADSGGVEPPGTQLFNNLTDVNGEISFSYNLISDQPVIGRVRKASNPPFYKPSEFSATINSGGLNLTILMVIDQ